MSLYKKRIIFLVIVIIQIITFSCKKEEKDIYKKVSLKEIECVVEFPDTVYVNQKYNGVIRYKSILDTITTSFDDKKKDRYVIFYLKIVDKPDFDSKYQKKNAKMIGADNNRKISINDIIFTKTGIHYIDGVLNDYVLIDLNKKDKEGFELLREIEKDIRVTQKVVVINRLDKESKGISVPVIKK
jgi:hypothetical protein